MITIICLHSTTVDSRRLVGGLAAMSDPRYAEDGGRYLQGTVQPGLRTMCCYFYIMRERIDVEESPLTYLEASFRPVRLMHDHVSSQN